MPRKILKAFLIQELAASPGLQRLVVGFSGGLDSTVLLQALAQEASAFSLPMLAVHVHHGLSPNADAWAQHAEAQCAALNIPVQICRVQVSPQGSVEAAARTARRTAFAGVLKAGDVLLLAQHQDDQAETLLFRLLRGAGVRGLAAMAEVSRFPLRNGVFVPQWRPLLGVSRAELEQWARAEDLHWIEDESNADSRYARNFLRKEVFPLLRTRWPVASETLAATAARLREADELLMELAVELASKTVDAQQRLHIPQVLALTPARQRLLLRHWLQQQDLLTPDEAMLDRIRKEAMLAREDAAPLLQWEGAEIRRYREHLYAMRPLSVMPENWDQIWNGEQDLLLPDGRFLRLESVPENLRVTYRRGGERVQIAGHCRELKTLFQEHGVPPWERERLPLLWRNNELLGVAGTDWGLRTDAPVTRLLLSARKTKS